MLDISRLLPQTRLLWGPATRTSIATMHRSRQVERGPRRLELLRFPRILRSVQWGTVARNSGEITQPFLPGHQKSGTYILMAETG
jgi:hypothetical protein